MKNNTKRRPFPSVILGNVCSLQSKLDELQANVYHLQPYRNMCILTFMEMWLDSQVPDSELHINGFGTPIQLDRDSNFTGKKKGAGICLYIN